MLARRRSRGETRIPLTEPDLSGVFPDPGGRALRLESESLSAPPAASIRSTPLGERARLGLPVASPMRLAIGAGEHQDVGSSVRGGTEGVEQTRFGSAAEAGGPAPGIDLCLVCLVVCRQDRWVLPSSGDLSIPLLERRPDHGDNRQYRGRHDEAAGGSRI